MSRLAEVLTKNLPRGPSLVKQIGHPSLNHECQPSPHGWPDFSRFGSSIEPTGHIRSVGNIVRIPLLREFPCELRVLCRCRKNRSAMRASRGRQFVKPTSSGRFFLQYIELQVFDQLAVVSAQSQAS